MIITQIQKHKDFSGDKIHFFYFILPAPWCYVKTSKCTNFLSGANINTKRDSCVMFTTTNTLVGSLQKDLRSFTN